MCQLGRQWPAWMEEEWWERTLARRRDSDGRPKGRDAAERLDGEAATARAEGIAQEENPDAHR